MSRREAFRLGFAALQIARINGQRHATSARQSIAAGQTCPAWIASLVQQTTQLPSAVRGMAGGEGAEAATGSSMDVGAPGGQPNRAADDQEQPASTQLGTTDNSSACVVPGPGQRAAEQGVGPGSDGVAGQLEHASDVRTLLQLVHNSGEDFHCIDVHLAFERLAELAGDMDREQLSELHADPQFVALVDMAMGAAAVLDASQLAGILHACGRLHYEDHNCLDSLSREIMSKVDRMTSDQVVQTVVGLALADHSPSVVLFDALRERVKVLHNELDGLQTATLQRCFDKLGYPTDGI